MTGSSLPGGRLARGIPLAALKSERLLSHNAVVGAGTVGA